MGKSIMIVIGDYSIEQYTNQNKIIITLPQTAATVTNTTIPFSHRKTELTNRELAMILISVMKEMEPLPEQRAKMESEAE